MGTAVTQKERDFSLDFLKALAIFLVCQTHYMHYANTALDNFVAIASCMGVPLFFMVNGALLMNKELDVKRHYKKTFRIFGLCIIWKIISVIVMALVWKKNVFENGLAQLLNYFIGKNELEGYELGHFWYLYALVGIYTIFPLFKICYDTGKGRQAIKYVMWILAFFSFGVSTLNFLLQLVSYYANWTTEFSFGWITSYYIFGTYGYCVLWFVLGGILHPKIARLRQDGKYADKSWICFLIFGIGWLLLFLMNRFQNVVGEAQGIVVDGYYCIPTLVMCVAIFAGSGLALYGKSNRLILFISKNTWGIYMLHMLVGTVFLIVQGKYGFPCGIALNLVKSIWMMAASLLMVSILKRIPILRGLVTF